MPITINLLEEEQRRMEARLFDPLQVVLRISLSVLVVLLLVIGVLFFLKQRAIQNLEDADLEWAALEKDAKRLAQLKSELSEVHNQLLNYAKYSQQRLLWGTELDILRDLVPNRVYLTDIRGFSKYERSPRVAVGLKPITAAPGAEKTGREGSDAAAAEPKPVEQDVDVETREIVIQGRVRSEKDYEVAQLVDTFVTVLRTDPRFSAQVANPKDDISIEQVINPADTTGDGDGPLGKEGGFTIRCKLKPVILE